MAVQAKVPLHLVALLRRGHSSFHIVYGKPIEVQPGMSKREAVQYLTQESAKWYQSILPVAMDQWVVFHPAWQAHSEP